MDQEVVDQLSLESIPYFQQQLDEALQHIVVLHEKLELTDLNSEKDCRNEDFEEDPEVDFQETLSVIHHQHYDEIQTLDEVRQKQQEEFQILFQQLKELEQMTHQLKQCNKSDDCYIQNATQLIQEKQIQLQQLSQEFLKQDIQNKENERVIQDLQSCIGIDYEIHLQDGSNQKTMEMSQLGSHRRQESEDSIDQVQYFELTSYKQKLQEEVEILLKKQKMIKQKCDNETQTNLHDFPQRPKDYDDFGNSYSQFQPTFSVEHTPQTSQILLHSLLKEERKQRVCCQNCAIF